MPTKEEEEEEFKRRLYVRNCTRVVIVEKHFNSKQLFKIKTISVIRKKYRNQTRDAIKLSK